METTQPTLPKTLNERKRAAHAGHTGHEGGEGADDGQELGVDDGLAAMFLVEGLSLLEMAPAEDTGIGVGKEADTDEAAEEIAAVLPSRAAQMSVTMMVTMSSRPAPATTPTVKSRLSPGRKKPTRRPVSEKTMPNRSA